MLIYANFHMRHVNGVSIVISAFTQIQVLLNNYYIAHII